LLDGAEHVGVTPLQERGVVGNFLHGDVGAQHGHVVEEEGHLARHQRIQMLQTAQHVQLAAVCRL